jgi:8-oxo-dGTP pyrophosphatase MutT (NUDIX family)
MEQVVLQHRALWSHHGGTWGIPGGARHPAESAVDAAVREAEEEAGLAVDVIRPVLTMVDDHGSWAYTTVVADTGPGDTEYRGDAVRPRPANAESIDVRWVRAGEVDALPLHPGFAATWPALRCVPAPPRIVIDVANVMGSRPDGWWRDRAGAAWRLRDRIVGLAATGLPTSPVGSAAAGLTARWFALGSDVPAPARVDLVFPLFRLVVEGAAAVIAGDPPATAGLANRPAAVSLAAAAANGDDTVVAEATASVRGGSMTLVVTADRELSRRVRTAGADVVRPGWLLDHLDQLPPR